MVVKTAAPSSAGPGNNLKRVRKPPATSASKICKAVGCERQVRTGASYCISHGGGNTCERAGCTTSARHGSIYCIAHGGGRRCGEPGCTKSAVGSTDFCKAHGGGRRCTFPGCFSAARPGQPQMCMKHGGGKRCALPTCGRSAAARSDYCSEHRHIDGGDQEEKKRTGQKGRASGTLKKGEAAGKKGRNSKNLVRESTRPSFTATDITVPPLNIFLEDFRNAEDLGPPLLFTVGDPDLPSPCDTPDELEDSESEEDEEAEEEVTMYTHPFARFMYNGI